MTLPPDPPPPRRARWIAEGGTARLLGDGIVYASTGLDTWTVRHAATVVVAVSPREPAFVTAQGRVQGRLLVVRPMVPKRLLALQAPLVLIDLEPNHPLYRCFLRAPDDPGAPGTCALPLAQHPAMLDMAQGFFDGRLRGHALDGAVQQALQQLVRAFPEPPPLDERVRRMMALLDEDPTRSLTDLARDVGVSPHRASQLFSRSLGLPWRRYVLSVKIRRAAGYMGSGRRLTDVAQAAGFVDSAHFAKVWIQCYGASPSAFFPAERTAMDAQALPDWRRWQRDGLGSALRP
jgi:AraC-like DNA-binding protein